MSTEKPWRPHEWAPYPKGHAHAGAKGCLKCGRAKTDPVHAAAAPAAPDGVLAEYQPRSTRGLSTLKQGLIGSRVIVSQHGNDWRADVPGIGEILFDRDDLRFA